jgi:hypothetical protein
MFVSTVSWMLNGLLQWVDMGATIAVSYGQSHLTLTNQTGL